MPKVNNRQIGEKKLQIWSPWLLLMLQTLETWVHIFENIFFSFFSSLERFRINQYICVIRNLLTIHNIQLKQYDVFKAEISCMYLYL
jgi:hypothetical protein